MKGILLFSLHCKRELHPHKGMHVLDGGVLTEH